MDVAESIGPGLAKATICAGVDGEPKTYQISSTEMSISLITSKDPDGVDVIRHSFAHLIGHGKQLFPGIKWRSARSSKMVSITT